MRRLTRGQIVTVTISALYLLGLIVVVALGSYAMRNFPLD